MDNRNDYAPAPMDTSEVIVPDELNELIDYLAKNAHEVWAMGRMAEGKTYGESNDSVKGKNAFLKPFEAMNPAEKLADINSVEQTVKFILNSGYRIEKVDNSYWGGIERKYFRQYHSDKAVPIYKAPLIIGLVSDNCSASIGEIHKSVDGFAAHITKLLGIPCEKCENSKRETPVYIISELSNDIELSAANYAFENYGFETITVNNPISGYKSITIPCPAEDYITTKSFMLLSFWKGMDKQSRAGSAVRKALLEYDRTSPDPQRTVIGESHAVYHVVLPGDAPAAFAWKSRLLLPYVLESGENWYTLRDAQIVYDRKSRQELIMGQTAATVANGSIKSIVRDEVKAVRQQYKADRKALDAQHDRNTHKKLIAESANKELTEEEKAHIRRLIKLDDEAYAEDKKALRRKLRKNIARAKNKIDYNNALEASKKERYELNLSMFGNINRSIEKGSSARKTPQEYDLLGDSTHGRSLSADAVNIRHLRLDTIATLFQKAKKRQTTLVAIFAAVGLGFYGVFSDLASSRSLIGILGGCVSALAIIAALVIFMISQHKNYHSVHLNLRLLSEMLRVKTYLNASGIYDTDASELLSERQRQELEWAQHIYRGWDVIDTAEGYYEPDAQKPIDLDTIRKMWIGSADSLLDGHSNAKVYIPTSDNAQMDFDRGRGSEYFRKARNLSIFRNFASVFAVVMTLGVTITTAVMFLLRSGLTAPDSWQGLFSDQFDTGTLYTVAESLFVFFIGIIPALIGCALIFHESQMYSENALRYKWMAVKYQKLTACLDSTLYTSDSDEAARRILKDAARAAIEEIGEWTLLTAGSEVALPF